MRSSLSRKNLLAAAAGIAVLAGVIGWLLMSIPPIVGLGDKVKLPLLHGGSTWVNLVIFTLMGLAGIAYLATRDDRVYSWEVGLRAVATPLWFVNSLLGYIAASSTWDFSASHQSRLTVVLADPRLLAQILLAAGVVILLLAVSTVLERRWHKSIADIAFVVVMWGLMANIFLDPVKRALHPDSPVLNSGWDIKAPFFGMVAAIFAIALVVSWIASSFVPSASELVPAEDAAESR